MRVEVDGVGSSVGRQPIRRYSEKQIYSKTLDFLCIIKCISASVIQSPFHLQVGRRNSKINYKMSGGIDALTLKEEDVTKFLGCSTHLGAQNVDFQMEQYVFKRKPDGEFIW